MFCPKCGTQNPDGSRFCASCGAAFAARPGQVPPPAAPSAVAPEAPSGPKRRRWPAAVAVVAALAAVGAVVLLVVNLFFGGSGVEEAANLASLGYGIAGSHDGYDYFFSSERQAICCAKPDGSGVEDVLPVPQVSVNGFENPEFYVTYLAMSGDKIFYVANCYDYETYETTNEVRCVNADGSDDHLVLEVPQDDGDTYHYVSGIFAYDGRAYVAVNENDGDESTAIVMSSDSSGADARTECRIRDASARLITPERVYYVIASYSSSSGIHSELYACNIDGSERQLLYEDDASVLGVALWGSEVVFSLMDYDSSRQSVQAVDVTTLERRTVCAALDGDYLSFLALSDGHAYVARYDEDLYQGGDATILRVSVDSGEATEICSVTFFNCSAGILNGHMLFLENGTDIGSVGYAARALSLEDGSTLAIYV